MSPAGKGMIVEAFEEAPRFESGDGVEPENAGQTLSVTFAGVVAGTGGVWY